MNSHNAGHYYALDTDHYYAHDAGHYYALDADGTFRVMLMRGVLRWEAVKYYFAERYLHSAKKYLAAFLTGKKSNTSQQQ